MKTASKVLFASVITAAAAVSVTRFAWAQERQAQGQQQPGGAGQGAPRSQPGDGPQGGFGGPGGGGRFGGGGGFGGGMMGMGGDRPILKQFDTDKNGRLDAQERAAAREFVNKNPGRGGVGGPG